MNESQDDLLDRRNSGSEPAENFGKRVRVARESLGKGQAWLSERLQTLGVPLSKTALSRLEGGYRAVKLSEAVVLCEVLDLDLNLRDLRGEQDELSALVDAAEERVAEASDAARAADLELDRAEQKRDARTLLRDAVQRPTESFEWQGTTQDLLSTAFGRDHGAARVALRAVGVPEEMLVDDRAGAFKRRGHFYKRLSLAEWLPNLTCVEDDEYGQHC
ncbi:helix-turn-helix domain-containing protein [Nesterenkonia halobia]|uniref:HTH cro/C1-type domain-containing protein n=1 Tax=Nesterenkonia halobia TaxID=37922 RepID=A0ABP6R6N6_9MICC